MKLKRFLLGLLVAAIALLTVGALFTIFTPYPASWMIRKAFDGGMEIKPDNYDEIEARVKVHEDLDYGSAYGSGQLDIFSPLNADKALPVIIWVHGGAFVGGDKHDLYAYATQIADKGYHVVSMNYELSPEGQYPNQIKQIAEVYQYLQKRNGEYGLDLDKVFLAGDSAGAHMMAQFAMIQTDPSYAQSMKIEAVMDPKTIRGALLLCGPYDLAQFADLAEGSKVLNFFLGRVAWAYLGEKNWVDDPAFEPLSIVDKVSPAFPNSFIMDGTVNTFTEHGKLLAQRLKSMNVEVSEAFYDEPGLELQHEYQFQMDNEYSVKTFNKMIEFLDKYSK